MLPGAGLLQRVGVLALLGTRIRFGHGSHFKCLIFDSTMVSHFELSILVHRPHRQLQKTYGGEFHEDAHYYYHFLTTEHLSVFAVPRNVRRRHPDPSRVAQSGSLLNGLCFGHIF
jgi:hypothetical protein